jgi:3-phosphoshikimate 1-carboxyvinyltransferase
VPGDKSISHRALLVGAISEGRTRVRNLLGAEDVASTAECLRRLGVEVTRNEKGETEVEGRGLRGLRAPEQTLEAGNSGTTMRLLLGLLAAHQFEARLDGDASLRRRPMDRVARPLSEMGAELKGEGERLLPPITVRGARLRGIDYESPIASAQVKSAVLLAALMAQGKTRYREPGRSRDHTERMLRQFGAEIRRGEDGTIDLTGGTELFGQEIDVPGDLSAAAFFLVAASLVAGSKVALAGVGVNETRSGILRALAEMGARVTVRGRRSLGEEPVADLEVEAAALRGGEIGGELIPELLDEVPLLAVAGACARGETRISGAEELRVKESDRLAAMAQELRKMGVEVEELADGLLIRGGELRGARVTSHGDHRVAMALAVAGLAARGETVVEEAECISASFPGFCESLRELGAEVVEEETEDGG